MYLLNLCCICVRLISHWCNAFIEKDWKCKLPRVGMVQDTASNFILELFSCCNLFRKSDSVIWKIAFLSSQIHVRIQYVNSGLMCQKPTLFDSLNAQIRNYQIYFAFCAQDNWQQPKWQLVKCQKTLNNNINENTKCIWEFSFRCPTWNSKTMNFGDQSYPTQISNVFEKQTK